MSMATLESYHRSNDKYNNDVCLFGTGLWAVSAYSELCEGCLC